MSKLLSEARRRETRVQPGEGTTMDWLVDDSIVEGAGLTMARMTVMQGRCTEGHRHPNCNEVIHLIEGRVEQAVGGECFVMEPGDTAYIPAGRFHRTSNIGESDATMIVSYSAGTRIYEPVDAAGYG